jgi:hypothetical protein
MFLKVAPVPGVWNNTIDNVYVKSFDFSFLRREKTKKNWIKKKWNTWKTTKWMDSYITNWEKSYNNFRIRKILQLYTIQRLG